MAQSPVRLWHATLTLVAGGAVAQALPLLLGPLLSRLYTPGDFGIFTAFATVAANLAVVACARYEFALPMARDDGEARALMALSLRVLAAVTAVTSLVAVALAATGRLAHAEWLPLAVAAAGIVQLFIMWATREQQFRALSVGRVLQYGGAAILQAGAGLVGARLVVATQVAAVSADAGAGPLGLVLGPVIAALLTAAWLRPRTPGGWRSLWAAPGTQLREVARRYREFPLLNTPHAFAGALQDTLAVALLAAWSGDVAVGFWGLALRYLKAPATLVGGAVSQALYPKLANATPDEARRAVRQVMRTLALVAVPLMGVLLVGGPTLFAWVFGERWRGAGELARALAPYIAVHFVAAPLAVVTMAWQAQAWALRLALMGQLAFVGALALGLRLGGLVGAGWAVSAAMVVYFGWYFWKLATWKEIAVAGRA